MKFIFVDNYRGFTEALIPIRDVNFLVGENSTGKTSILGLLKLLSPHEFWLQNDFDLRQVGLGTFRDVVSIAATDKSYFSVGIVFDSQERRGEKKSSNENIDKKSVYAFMMTFVEKEGVPKIASIVSYKNGREIRIKYIGDSVRYKTCIKNYDLDANQFGCVKMNDWINFQKTDTSGYTILKGNKLYLRNAPPIIILSFIENSIIQSDNNEESVGFEIPSFINDIAWLAPIRSKPRKTYDEYSLEFSPEGDHTPYIIKNKLDSKSGSNKFKRYLSSIGKKSGLFKEVQIKNYGRGSTSPFELDVVLSNEPLSVSSVGYGVSQALPVIVEMFTRPKNSWFAIQQPEVHLHPKAQAALGEVIFNLASSENKKFIIETHSDYTIDRYRISSRKSDKNIDSQILFFERTENGNKLTPIMIDNDGNISDNQPDSYRQFFLKEEMELLGL